MKLSKLVIVAASVVMAASAARAAHIWEDPGGWSSGLFYYDTQTTAKYTANEFSFDFFGSYLNPERNFDHLFKENIHHGTWGGGVGANYFFTREIGIGGDINFSAHSGNLTDQVLGNLIIRIPIDPSGFAPYIFGGGGRAFSPEWEWLFDAGVGVEYRLNTTTGIFSDARYIWADKNYDRLLIRAGLRIVF
jgi:hypothetical protein